MGVLGGWAFSYERDTPVGWMGGAALLLLFYQPARFEHQFDHE